MVWVCFVPGTPFLVGVKGKPKGREPFWGSDSYFEETPPFEVGAAASDARISPMP